jgi:thiamine-phosphate pyrophosphorylase
VALAARVGLDAVLVSPVFESRSLSAGRALGPLRFARMARGARLPVYALGGVTARTARRLAGTGASGVAAVEAMTEI